MAGGAWMVEETGFGPVVTEWLRSSATRRAESACSRSRMGAESGALIFADRPRSLSQRLAQLRRAPSRLFRRRPRPAASPLGGLELLSRLALRALCAAAPLRFALAARADALAAALSGGPSASSPLGLCFPAGVPRGFSTIAERAARLVDSGQRLESHGLERTRQPARRVARAAAPRASLARRSAWRATAFRRNPPADARIASRRVARSFAMRLLRVVDVDDLAGEQRPMLAAKCSAARIRRS